jgi:hypothetical protein
MITVTVEQLAANPRLVDQVPPTERMRLARAARIATKVLELAELLTPEPPMPPDPEKLVGLDVAADHLGVKKSRVSAAARRGDFPVVMAGRTPKIRPAVLARLIENGLPMGPPRDHESAHEKAERISGKRTRVPN